MMIKRKFIIVMMLFVCCLASGCSNKNKEEIELIKNSLEAQEYFQVNEYQIEDIKIISSKENRKSATKVDTCNLVFSNEIVRYSGEFELKFVEYSDGWILENPNEINEKDCKSEPVTGVNEEKLKDMLSEHGLIVAQTKWTYKQVQPAKVTINSQKTDLKKGTDSVICSFDLSSEYLTVNCNIEVNCKFDKNYWKFVSAKDTGKSILTLNEDLNGYAKFDVSDDEIKEYVQKKLYSGYDEYSRKKDQSYVKDNISNFKVVDKYYTNKGQTLTYKSTLDYHTAMADLSLTCEIPYSFDKYSGWRSYSVHENIEDVKVSDLTGTWMGSTLLPYFYEFTQTLTIDSMDKSGNFKGTYNIVKRDFSNPSKETTTEDTFKVEGKFKFEADEIGKNKIEYTIEVADGNVSDGRVITMTMNPNSEALSLQDSYVNGVTYSATSLTK